MEGGRGGEVEFLLYLPSPPTIYGHDYMIHCMV